jgi:mannose-6-phosphate isomerase-like protein (cupin superfamily)
MTAFEVGKLPEHYDVLAPDGSEIRLLASSDGGSMVHCTLQRHRKSMAIRHRTVEELWYVVGGRGEVWRKFGSEESVSQLETGSSLKIPLGTHFQFRNTGEEPLVLVIATIPPWPGDDEAVRVSDFWEG